MRKFTKKVGFTSTIPVEILFSASKIPLDMNNLFISNKNREELLYEAEKKGMPRTICSWIKGIYALFKEDFESIVFVEGGDCSNTNAIREIADYDGIDTYSFFYPKKPDNNLIKIEIEKMCSKFSVVYSDAQKIFERLKSTRKKLYYIDEFSYKNPGVISGEKIFEQLISATDFTGNIDEFENKIDYLIDECNNSDLVSNNPIRIGLCGVPPIYQDIFEYIESKNGYVVYNEIPVEFAMINNSDTIEEAYTKYTYPYGIINRIIKIKSEIKRRKIDGIIHYVQSFCYRNIENIILKKDLNIPVLTLEGDSSFFLSPREKLRIENFIDMLK